MVTYRVIDNQTGLELQAAYTAESAHSVGQLIVLDDGNTYIVEDHDLTDEAQADGGRPVLKVAHSVHGPLGEPETE